MSIIKYIIENPWGFGLILFFLYLFIEGIIDKIKQK